MARIRSVKPEVCRSHTLVQVPRAARFTFVCLWTICDDEGRARYDAQLLAADLYPLDAEVTAEVMEADIESLAHVGAICIYEVAGRRYLHVPAWHEHQHPNRKWRSQLPHCSRSEHAVPTQCSGSAQAVLVVGSKELVVGSREEKKKSLGAQARPAASRKTQNTSLAPDSFEVSLALRSWAKDQGITANLTTETEQWLDHHRAKASRMVDWTASWRTWMRNTVKYGATEAKRKPPTSGGDW